MKETTILVFGDSITYGVADFENGGWVNRLRLYYDNKYKYDYKVFNLGISGDVTEDTLKRVEIECERRHRKDNITLIVFAIGINDTQKLSGKERVTVDRFRSNIINLINKARIFTNDILFIGLTNVDETRVVPIPWNVNKSFYNKRIIEYDNIIESICNEQKVLYLKTFNLLSSEELSDGLHPDSEGHKKIFTEIKNKIDTIFE